MRGHGVGKLRWRAAVTRVLHPSRKPCISVGKTVKRYGIVGCRTAVDPGNKLLLGHRAEMRDGVPDRLLQRSLERQERAPGQPALPPIANKPPGLAEQLVGQGR